ncbi:unnamed protein product [Paramecium sonneborni]|uniref:Uncharacterized protein n=1 Tax=Paramecium sonneborni TaxID=65129 RepID=A0A8S1RMS2_9CILI|nr:unnamed protein product [Paramecium sonneborni]
MVERLVDGIQYLMENRQVVDYIKNWKEIQLKQENGLRQIISFG